MRVVALDIGSSSVKAAALQSGRIIGKSACCAFPTRYGGDRAEVCPDDVLAAIRTVMQSLKNAGRADVLALCAMAPSWIAMDKRGKPLTNIITHQDRRSIEIAIDLERMVGKQRYLELAGNRPFPGGISSTTAAWHVLNCPALMKPAALVGHLSTYLVHRWTGRRVIDPSNASFMGVYATTTLGGWSGELLDAVGLRGDQMPNILEADQVAGKLLPSATAELGLPAGLPVLPGIIDTSAAVFLAGAKDRTLYNVCGSTDVLALCVDEPRPHELLLTRALGVGRKWMAVSTLASAGTTLTWLHRTLFADLSEQAFHRMVARQLKRHSPIRFDPYLAGDRMSIERKQGAFVGLTLASTREQMLQAALDALARESAQRIPLLQGVYGRISPKVTIAGRAGVALAHVLHRDWPGKWTFRSESEATLRGLAVLAGCMTH